MSKQTTGVPNHFVTRLTDPWLMRCPFLLGSDVGTMSLRDEEVTALRDYLLKGGFFWVDDFWGSRAWDVFEQEMARVLPPGTYPFRDLGPDHPIYRTMFQSVSEGLVIHNPDGSIRAANAAAERVENAWMGSPAGRQILQRTNRDLSRSSADFSTAVARVIRDWQGDVLELVSAEGAGKKAGARVMAFGVNGVGLALMMIVFFNTGGITGAEVGIAGGTVVIAQRFLEAIFGEDGVRRMAKIAKEALDARIEALMAVELDRYRQALDTLEVDPERRQELESALDGLRASRADGVPLAAAPPRPAERSGRGRACRSLRGPGYSLASTTFCWNTRTGSWTPSSSSPAKHAGMPSRRSPRRRRPHGTTRVPGSPICDPRGAWVPSRC